MHLTSCPPSTVSSYGVTAGSLIAAIGDGEPRSSKEKAKGPRTEESTVSQIRGELEKVQLTLSPDVELFLSSLAPAEPTQTTAKRNHPRSAPSSSGSQQTLDAEREHVRLGELLLQSLLRLDAIQTEGEWEVARQERKGAVKGGAGVVGQTRRRVEGEELEHSIRN